MLELAYYELYVSRSNVLGGFQTPFEKAKYVIIGVPFDATSTFRTGARFAPNAIREASLNIETYSLRAGIDLEEVTIHDLGDLHVTAGAEGTLQRTELVIKDLLEAGKTPIVLGGEHTITLGCYRGIKNRSSRTAVISFDAHLDLRNEYMGLKVSHTTFMRRLSERLNPAKIVEVGTRAVCKEELDYAVKADVKIFTMHEIRKQGIERTIKELNKALDGYNQVYVTVDMDVLDPAFAPAVQNPEPEGMNIGALLEILRSILTDKKAVALDLVEVTPHYDFGVTAIGAAKILFEVLCYMEKTHGKS